MAIVWPPALPTKPERGWTETKLENRVRSETDTGPAKMRRRFTRAVRRIQMQMILTESQTAILDTFHTTTLGDGVLPFEFVHPRTGLTHEFRFVGDLEWGEPADGMYVASFEWEYQL